MRAIDSTQGLATWFKISLNSQGSAKVDFLKIEAT
jgi:hypothetical protein